MSQGKKQSLTADDWTLPALRAIARGGLAAVRVEAIAKEIGTTKGSFYWHFTDRDALIAAALEHWEIRDTAGVITIVEQDHDPADRLRSLLRIAFTAAATDDSGSVELALQAHADHPLVAPVLARVTSQRLGYVTQLFAELGLSPAQARDRALLGYTSFLGHAQLAHATPELVPQGRAFTRHVNQVIETLVAVG